jgi:hypothetical protein
LSKEHALELPVGGLELACDAARELAGLFGGRVALLADDQFRPRERGVDVDRAELPDRALGAAQAPDIKQSIATSWPGRSTLMWRSGAGSRGGSQGAA